MGKLKDTQIKLHIDENVTPIAQPARRVPFHIRKALDKALDELEDNEIIEPAIGTTPWVSPLVVFPKPSNLSPPPYRRRIWFYDRADVLAIRKSIQMFRWRKTPGKRGICTEVSEYQARPCNFTSVCHVQTVKCFNQNQFTD